MTLAMIDGTMVREFVEDAEAFNRGVDELFACLDSDGDGVLSRDELLKGFEGLLMASEGMGSEPATPAAGALDEAAVFEKFDGDGSGGVDREEFRAEMREVMLAVARGIGESPIHVALNCGPSFLTRIIEHGQPCSN